MAAGCILVAITAVRFPLPAMPHRGGGVRILRPRGLHLEQVEIRITKLKALKKELMRMIGECGHGRVSHCRVIEVLSDHRHCATGH